MNDVLSNVIAFILNFQISSPFLINLSSPVSASRFDHIANPHGLATPRISDNDMPGASLPGET
jgi:hypothetical protein